MILGRHKSLHLFSWLMVSIAALMGCSESSVPPERERDRAATTSQASLRRDAEAGSTATPRRTKQKINLLLITVDTTRADALNPYGQPRVTSPRIDRLARRGVVFEQTSSSAPSTLPSHATILSGRLPFAHGVRANAGYTLPGSVTTLAEVLKQHGYRTAAEIAAMVLNSTTRLDQGFDQYRDLAASDIERVVATARAEGGGIHSQELYERPSGDITKHAKKFIRRERDQPFFLWAHYFDPHVFYVRRPRYLDQLPDSPYHAEILYMDDAIGELLDEVERLGLQERTLVVLVADHGESLGEHGEDTHSHFLYESTIRVPFIIAGPRALVPAGRRVPSLVRTADIAPTILDLLGLPPLAGIDGRSLRPLLQDPRGDLQLAAYSESIELSEIFGSSPLRALRVGDWKYIHKLEPELYRLVDDPAELENLAAVEPQKLAAMRSRLERLIRDAPPSPSDARVARDPEVVQQLQALGYLGGGAEAAQIDEALRSPDVYGPDPNQLVDEVRIYAKAVGNAGAGLHSQAVEKFTPIVEKYPTRAAPKIELAASLAELERWPEVRLYLERALEQAPCSEVARSLLSQALLAMGDSAADLAQLEQGATHCPDSYLILNNYAYALVNHSDVTPRDTTRAVRIGMLAVELSGGTRPDVLDTLASAYSANGEHALAIEVSERAVALAVARLAPPGVRDVLNENLARYRAAAEPSASEPPLAD